ncbi:MAG TPA: alpha/beta hydrolase [Candidatus Acidoferrales bacterium]|nr:alpha/beta hydrolase [Candidatus Acidoferrales bacterium]
MNAFRCLFRAAIIGAIVSTQIAAAQPHKPPPYNLNLYLQPQRLVDIGGRRLNIICTGTGSPTVILEAGLLADSTAWRLVQPAISRTTRVCSYDRAGLGFSDPTGPPRDAAAIVRDLHALLANAGVAPPYVLVGWSSGGLYTRLYQYRYPREVVGLVEVDPDSEFEPDDYDAKIVTTIMHKPQQWYDTQIRDWYKQYDNCALNVSRGTCDFFPGGLAAYHQRLRAAGCPAVSRAACAIAEIRGEHMNRASFWKDEDLELKASQISAAEVRAAERPYGKLPLIVLTDSENGDIDGDGPITVAAQRAEWVAKNKAEEHIARLSAVGAHFVVAGSSHAIQLDHPAVVISAVDEVIDQARYR